MLCLPNSYYLRAILFTNVIIIIMIYLFLILILYTNTFYSDWTKNRANLYFSGVEAHRSVFFCKEIWPLCVWVKGDVRTHEPCDSAVEWFDP